MMNPIEPLHFGNFEVMQRPDGSHWLLGEGGYGRTYKAKHRFLRRVCALKIIHERHMRDRQQRARFLQEARTAAQLDHPGVAKVYDFGEEAGAVFYAMEFCQGGTLDEFSRGRGAMSWEEVAGLGQQMADGLACAHGAGLLHRDLKPQNVMRASTREPPELKLIDFGLVKVIAPEGADTTLAAMSRDGGFKGNYATASPEQTSEWEELDERSDLFSLGVILWWLLLGESPFAGLSHAKLISDRLSGDSYESRLPPGLDPEGSSILARLLEKKRDARFGSAAELSAALSGKKQAAGRPKKKPRKKAAAAAEATPPVAAPRPGLFEETFNVLSVLDDLQATKVYRCQDGAGRFYSALIPAEHAEQGSIDAISKLARSGKDFGCMECVGEWRTESDQPAFIFGDMGPTRLLDVLKALDDAPLADVAPVLGHLAGGIDHLRDHYGVDIEINPHLLRVGGEGGGLASWERLDPGLLRAFPRVHAGELPADYSADSTILSNDASFPLAAQFGTLVYRLVSGITATHAAFITTDAYVPAAALSEKGNQFLARVISGGSPDLSTVEIVRQLLSIESIPSSVLGSGFEIRDGTGEVPVPLPARAAAEPVADEVPVEVPAPPPPVEVPVAEPVEPPPPLAPARPAAAPKAGGKRSMVVPVVIAAVVACLALAAWPLYRFLNRSDEAGGGVAKPEKSTPIVPAVSSTRIEFSSVTTDAGGIPPGARLALHDRQDAVVAAVEMTGSRAVAADVPVALFDDSGRWPASLRLESDNFRMDPVTLEPGDFQEAGEGLRRCTKIIELNPRAFLTIMPVTKFDGVEVDLPVNLIKRHLHPVDLSIDWKLSSDSSGITIALPPGGSLPLKVVFSLPHMKEFEFDLKESGPTTWDLRIARRTVRISGLGKFDRLQYLPDHEGINDPELRDVISSIVKPQQAGAEILDGEIAGWDLPAIDGTVEVAGSGAGWSFPVAAEARWKVLSDAERRGEPPAGEDVGFQDKIKDAEKGEINVQSELGLLFLEEPHVNKEASTAWFRMAALRGHRPAQHNLGAAYAKGLGVDQDPREAAKWYFKAAEQGFAASQSCLGAYYQHGDGVTQDFKAAEEWYLKAAAQDYAPAMYNLAVLYDSGNLGERDEKKIRDYLQQAAELGDAPALYNLGYGYEKGLWGLEKSRDKAIESYQAAVRNGSTDARKDLDRLRGKPPSP